jgi:hypothetical protein
VKQVLPPELRDGQYSEWNIAMAAKYPLALSEMRWPSAPLDSFGARALARWGIECVSGWRHLVDRMLANLETEIAAQPADQRDGFRIVQLKEKFGRLTVYLASVATPEMSRILDEAAEESTRTCDVCSAPGELAERGPLGWYAARCPRHESWTPLDESASLD